MKTLLVSAILIVVAAGAVAQPLWSTDWIGTFAKARHEQRLVLVHVGSEDCVTCKEMERVTYADPVVVSALDPFLLMCVDARDTEKLGQFFVGPFRGLIVFDPTEQPRIHQRGYQTPEEFVKWVHLVRGSSRLLLMAAQRLEDGDAVHGNVFLGRAYNNARVLEGARKAFAAAAEAAAARGDVKNERLATIEFAVTWRDEDPERALKLLRAMDESPIREVEFTRQIAFSTILMKLRRPREAQNAFRRALAHCPEQMRADCDDHRREMDRRQSALPFPMPSPR